MTSRIQLTLMLSKGKGYWYRRLKKGNTRDRVEKSVSEVLGGPVKIVITPYGGLSLDVDDEEDFRILNTATRSGLPLPPAVEPGSEEHCKTRVSRAISATRSSDNAGQKAIKPHRNHQEYKKWQGG